MTAGGNNFNDFAEIKLDQVQFFHPAENLTVFHPA